MKDDSSEEESRRQRRPRTLKRRRASEEDEEEDSEGSEEEEEERPIRKRLNRIETDEEDEEEEKMTASAVQSDGTKRAPRTASAGEGGEKKGRSGAAPPTNGQAATRGLEGPVAQRATRAGPKNGGPAVSNGAGSQEEDEDDLLGVTDLVDYVCNSGQL